MKIINYLMLVLAVVLLAACGSEETADQVSENSGTKEELVKQVNVNVKELSSSQFTNFIRLVGEVKAKDDIMVSGEVSGRLVEYYVPEGGMVKKGQVFAKIDDELLLSDIERVQAMTENSRETYERLKKIWEEDSIGTKLELLNARYAFKQNNANLSSLNVQLRKTELKAPISGVLEMQRVKAGEMVTTGVPVSRIIGTENVKVVVGVPANYAAKVERGDSALVTFDAYPGREYKGRIDYVASSIESKSRTFNVEIYVPNKDRALKIDMVVNVTLETQHFEDVIVIGQQYVFKTEDGYSVYVVDKDDEGNSIARSQKVKLGGSYQNRVLISDGLEVGDNLITLGSGQVENQTRIKVINNSSESPNGIATR
jgi:RND family efflux transporter MFP subunit